MDDNLKIDQVAHIQDYEVKEILDEIKKRMQQLEAVSTVFSPEGGLDTVHAPAECAVAYNVLKSLYSYIDDMWG